MRYRRIRDDLPEELLRQLDGQHLAGAGLEKLGRKWTAPAAEDDRPAAVNVRGKRTEGT